MSTIMISHRHELYAPRARTYRTANNDKPRSNKHTSLKITYRLGDIPWRAYVTHISAMNGYIIILQPLPRYPMRATITWKPLVAGDATAMVTAEKSMPLSLVSII
ncbi:unnamed protein product [Macrosiphum euphorbiae]|uniref:Uncharacterized protein n=1 Tax=Macrosiphum euphorbiae TaxID=13131 RepID=A0AAV0XX14_9HEMI|nr:unnamed protein product [Macrosiphum euphorbiae]